MAPSEWLGLTPAQFFQMHRTHSMRARERAWEMAVLTAAVINSGFARPKSPVDPKDLMAPDPYAPKKATQKRRMTARRRQEVADGIREVMAKFMKKDGHP